MLLVLWVIESALTTSFVLLLLLPKRLYSAKKSYERGVFIKGGFIKTRIMTRTLTFT